ncbi:hypothetical protein GE061_005316 [Apolygus lucorum]|uniref:Peptidase S1 domain-containing protein n=1 Tax=Apolygus lucorum TaxID=248454 RepID=A0A8S9WXB6_APOLU|nr:hypothetical protein GE061_005316 [Apolygus lucorum]
MLCLTIIVVCITSSLVASEQRDFKLGDKWVSVIENAREDKLWLDNTTWNLSADGASKIRVFCTDFRTRPGSTEEETCDYGSLTLDDGISKAKYCGTQNDFVVYGNSSILTLDLHTNIHGGVFLECVAKAVREPKTYETVEISPKSGIKKISFPDELGEDNDKAWSFKSTEGKISLKCERRMEAPLDSGVCVRDVLTVDGGKGPIVSCGYEPVTVISELLEIKLRVETFLETEGHVDCIVQSLSSSEPKDEEPSPSDKEPSPETADSDEHGVSPGTKGTTCPCGKANRGGGRIINGTDVDTESKYPFMVSLRYPGGFHFCGASIISPLHILTAAHCVSDRWTKSQPEPDSVVPTVGVHQLYKDASHGETQRLKVKGIYIPDAWFAVNVSLAGDIAILVLNEPIKFSKYVSPVCLTPQQPDVVNKYIRMMGWGRTENGTPDILKEANALVLSHKVCNNNVKEVCFQRGPSASCFGDSGGPYVHLDPETNRYTQIALVSYGYGECNGRFYIGSNTAHWYDWIQEIVRATSGGHTEKASTCQKVD